ncbi:MAG: hypothetical protein HZC55_17555 [Verrucomicrobia bacterium]|nr:hypothetical protein [Verrucomicrobiota bacterium]
MTRPLSAADARQSLTDHVVARGLEALTRYGPHLGWDALQRLLLDRTQVRYPCTVVFSEAGLLPGELAHPAPCGDRPEDGFLLHVHPCFQSNRDEAAAVVLYQLVLVNYGEFASAHEAESYGAAALGLTRDEYYDWMCRLAERVPTPDGRADHSGGSEGGGRGS